MWRPLTELMGQSRGARGRIDVCLGAGGESINGFPLKGGFGATDAAGLSLASATCQALAESESITPAPLKAQTMKLTLSSRTSDYRGV
ncbi:MAG: hypothetical protein QGH37_04255 [Candidatus Poribacteria bacterium]|nr:hypothetical protein [Candidatus Poribacteria bacterium]